MKEIMKLIGTNWINVVSIFIATYIAEIISYVILSDTFTFRIALFAPLFSIILYGMMFWGFFLMTIIFLDTLFFSIDINPKYTIYKLVAEWVLISSPFIYWFVKYNQWIFLVAAFAFFVGQFLRRKKINKLLLLLKNSLK
jgi:hypothetical protein